MFNMQASWKLDVSQITWLQKAAAIKGKGPIRLAIAILSSAIEDECDNSIFSTSRNAA